MIRCSYPKCGREDIVFVLLRKRPDSRVTETRISMCSKCVSMFREMAHIGEPETIRRLNEVADLEMMFSKLREEINDDKRAT